MFSAIAEPSSRPKRMRGGGDGFLPFGPKVLPLAGTRK